MSRAVRIPWLTGKKTRTAPTVADLAEDYIERHLPTKRPSSREDDMRIIRVHVLPALGKVKVADIDHKTIAALHSKITKSGTPTRANAEAAAVEDVRAVDPLGLPQPTIRASGW